MKKIKRYGLPLFTEHGWGVIGKLLMIIGIVGLAITQLGTTWP